jgi:FtsZ-binding cell division protein ZapB
MGMQISSQQQQITFLQMQNMQLIANHHKKKLQQQQIDALTTENEKLVAEQNAQQERINALLLHTLRMHDSHTKQMNVMMEDSMKLRIMNEE